MFLLPLELFFTLREYFYIKITDFVSLDYLQFNNEIITKYYLLFLERRFLNKYI